ncbi:F0F1 ATP synthase subunit epsilon [Thiomicrorhabdus heinhorstiae]|uniref:F0F1 ATP synthase subunit epsilon n=2 Tax=Thiomicrorhabdus TaxID=2039723 RepID=A0ABS0BXY7_9GAMM|nr:F0F1 ATP synthase subunit epsilon [Thiomicrorhabdus heinhorstiae]MBF6057711.1 F0F1 ATP synthase subunit epsilon [Thiomicrorhabdus heinhorstiae]
MSFELRIQDTLQSERFEGVTSFIGEDASGSFGILAGHVRFMTSLKMGLSRFKDQNGIWNYIAAANALLYFRDDRLELTTRHFVIDRDYHRISRILQEQISEQAQLLAQQTQSLRRMEEAVLKRLWQLNREDNP